jgi:hypothetical protein
MDHTEFVSLLEDEALFRAQHIVLSVLCEQSTSRATQILRSGIDNRKVRSPDVCILVLGARAARRATGPRPSTARRAARSVVVPVARPGDDLTIGGCARRRRRVLIS